MIGIAGLEVSPAAAGVPPFLARLRTPASRVPVFEVGGRVTPYDLETLVGNAESFPRRSRLEVVLQAGASVEAMTECRERLAVLVARGIVVRVRRGDFTRADERRSIMERPDAIPAEPPPGAAPRPTGRRVLLAEDDPDMRRMVATLLRMAGHHVVEATDGADLLARLEHLLAAAEPSDGRPAGPVDVIVSDVDMPQLSGLDMLAALRCSRWSTPVVLITAYGDDETRAEARELGAALLDKPLDPEALRRAVATAVAARVLDA